MEDRHVPSSSGTKIVVDVRGAEIVAVPRDSNEREANDIYLPKHTEFISHIAIDIGGSLIKVVYFTRANSPAPPTSPPRSSIPLSSPSSRPSDLPPIPGPSSDPSHSRQPNGLPGSPQTNGIPLPTPNGYLGPESLKRPQLNGVGHHHSGSLQSLRATLRRRSITSSDLHSPTSASFSSSSVNGADDASATLPGGHLNFIKFETSAISSCILFLSTLIRRSASSNGVPLSEMQRRVKLMATGGGAHMFYDRLREELGVEVRREEEMDCLIEGLMFLREVREEVFWCSDELVEKVSRPRGKEEEEEVREKVQKELEEAEEKGVSGAKAMLNGTGEDGTGEDSKSTLTTESRTVSNDNLPRPSPNPPQYLLEFDKDPKPDVFPCLLVNIGSGVSIVKVDGYGRFERISGTSLGGGTLWGLLSLLTGARSFDEMLQLSDKGDNASVDMLVGDIYGSDYSKIGLKSSTIASSFGKVFRKGEDGRKREFKPEDISRSLLYAISNNIGQIAYMNAEKHGIDRIYFGGCYIRGHAATISTLSYAIRFWSKGTKRALFLRHEGFLGAIGAWLKNEAEDEWIKEEVSKVL